MTAWPYDESYFRALPVVQRLAVARLHPTRCGRERWQADCPWCGQTGALTVLVLADRVQVHCRFGCRPTWVGDLQSVGP